MAERQPLQPDQHQDQQAAKPMSEGPADVQPQNAAQVVRPSGTAGRPLSPAQLLGMQSSVGNRAVQRRLAGASRVQRHPSHAEEQEVQAQRDPTALQRHPSHAEEQEVQAQRDPTALQGAEPRRRLQRARATIQRIPIGFDEADPPQPRHFTVKQVLSKLKDEYHFRITTPFKAAIQKLENDKAVFDDWDELDAKLRKDGFESGRHKEKRMRLEATFGIPIGGESGAKQFGDKMLDKLDELLRLVPASHLGTLDGIERRKSDDVSFYDPNTNKITISYAQPAALYTWAKKNTSLIFKDARQTMEAVAIPVMLNSTNEYKKDKDAELGLDSTRRAVISYASTDATASTGIAEWSILHELGHAIDNKIKWTQRNGPKAEFGGWRTHGEFDETEARAAVATPYLADAGLTPDHLKALDESMIKIRNWDDIRKKQAAQGKDTAALVAKIEEARAKVGTGRTGWDQFLKNDMIGTRASDVESKANGLSLWSVDPDEPKRLALKAKLKAALEKLIYTQVAPWQFPDGLASKLTTGGRIYQLDHYKSWVSYQADQRKTPLSPYQFSSPGEWIAEAYAAFYGTNAAARALLSSATKAKIQEELGAPPKQTPEGRERAKGAFEAAKGGGSDGNRATLMSPEELAASKLPEAPVINLVEEDDPHQEPELEVSGPPETSPLSAALSDEDPFAL